MQNEGESGDVAVVFCTVFYRNRDGLSVLGRRPKVGVNVFRKGRSKFLTSSLLIEGVKHFTSPHL